MSEKQRPELSVWSSYNEIEKKLQEMIPLFNDAGQTIITVLFIYALAAEEQAQKKGTQTSVEFNREANNFWEEVKEEVTNLGKKEEAIGIKAIKEEVAKHTTRLNEMYGLTNDPPVISLEGYSDKVWQNKQKLYESLIKDVRPGILNGEDTTSIARKVMKTTGQTNEYNAYRLVRTEAMRALNNSTLDRYRAMGVTEVREVVTLDERTSEECLTHVDMIHPIDSAPVLPRRPNCRCTFAPVLETIDPTKARY